MRWAVAASVLLAASAARPCITLPTVGKAPVAVADETALIVWDAKTKTESFVRTATFTGADGPMAFLVPTPTPPTLKAVPELGFDEPFGTMSELKAAVAPRIVQEKRPAYRLTDDWTFTWWGYPASKSAGRQIATAGTLYMADADDVYVFGEGKVGGYDTAVLKAKNPKALLAWLKRHGFASDARLEGWLGPYTQKGWAITAFRFRPKGPTYVSDPVCLTFKTDRPFYPYREPAATNSPASRSLRVFLVAPGRQEGHLENGAWSAPTEYAGRLAPRVASAVVNGLDLDPGVVDGARLTSFLDRHAVRPDSELFFDAAPNQTPVEPPPVVRYVDTPYYLPKGLVATTAGAPVLLALVLVGARRRKR